MLKEKSRLWKYLWVLIPLAIIAYWFLGFFLYKYFFTPVSSTILNFLSAVFLSLILPILSGGIILGILSLLYFPGKMLYKRITESKEAHAKRKDRQKRKKELVERWKRELPSTPIARTYGGEGLQKIRTLYVRDQLQVASYENRGRIGRLLLFEEMVAGRWIDGKWYRAHPLEFAFIESELVDYRYIPPEQYSTFEKEFYEAQIKKEQKRNEMYEEARRLEILEEEDNEKQKRECWQRAGGKP